MSCKDWYLINTRRVQKKRKGVLLLCNDYEHSLAKSLSMCIRFCENSLKLLSKFDTLIKQRSCTQTSQISNNFLSLFFNFSTFSKIIDKWNSIFCAGILRALFSILHAVFPVSTSKDYISSFLSQYCTGRSRLLGSLNTLSRTIVSRDRIRL